MEEKTIEKDIIYQGKIVTLEKHLVEFNKNKHGYREIVKHPGASAILPVENEEIYLVKQYRKALEKELLEIPAGVLEPEEDPKICAERELSEELKLKAENLEYLTVFYPSPGYLNETVHLFLATGLSYKYTPQDEDENLKLEKKTINALKELIKYKQIYDSKTLISLMYYLLFHE